MENKTQMIIMVLLALTLLLNIALFAVLKARGGITGLSIKEGDQPLLQEDVIELNRADLTLCCSFSNSQGEEDSCYALKGHDCSYCSGYCS